MMNSWNTVKPNTPIITRVNDKFPTITFPPLEQTPTASSKKYSWYRRRCSIQILPMSTAPTMDNTNTLETDVPMYFESFRVGMVTLRVSQAKKIPNSSSNPWYVNTNEKKYALYLQVHWYNAWIITTWYSRWASPCKHTQKRQINSEPLTKS